MSPAAELVILQLANHIFECAAEPRRPSTRSVYVEKPLWIWSEIQIKGRQICLLSLNSSRVFSCGAPNRWKMHWSNLYESHKAKLTYSFTSPFTQYQSQSGVISCLPFWCHLEFRTRSQCWVGCLSPAWMCARETSNTRMSTQCSWGKYVLQRKADLFHCVPFKFTHWQACFVSSWWGLSGWKWDLFF